MGNLIFFFSHGRERTNGVKFIPPCSLRKFATLTCSARRGINAIGQAVEASNRSCVNLFESGSFPKVIPLNGSCCIIIFFLIYSWHIKIIRWEKTLFWKKPSPDNETKHQDETGPPSKNVQPSLESESSNMWKLLRVDKLL